MGDSKFKQKRWPHTDMALEEEGGNTLLSQKMRFITRCNGWVWSTYVDRHSVQTEKRKRPAVAGKLRQGRAALQVSG